MIEAAELEEMLDLSEVHTFDLPQLRVMHYLVSECLKLLGDYRSEIEAFIYEKLGPTQTYTLEGYKPITRKSGGTYEKWQGEEIRGHLAAMVADEVVDKDTGEIPPIHEIVARAMRVLAECAGTDNQSQKWRVGQLKERGLKPSEFALWRKGDQKRITIIK